MDVTMGKKTVVCYHKLFDYSDLCENAVESVVPDTMPDIERILCADGTLVIKSKEVTEGSVSVTGGISASVLYVPEGKSDVCCLRAAIPFSISADAPGVTSDAVPVATLSITTMEARMLNPRKVVVRANVAVTIACYERTEAAYCCEVNGEHAQEIQQLVEKRSISHVVCVKEKTFVVTDEYRVPAGKPKVGELLRDTVGLSAEEIRTVGGKIVINGTASVALTYKAAESAEITSVAFETAFSQLVEADRELTDPACTVGMLLTAVFIEPHTYTGGEAGFTCELHIVVQAVCSDSNDVDYISDCYSNKRQLRAESEPMRVICGARRTMQRIGFHEQLETAQTVREVGEVSCRASDFKIDDGTIKCKITAAVIYSDDTGAPYCVSRRFPVECSAGLEDGMTGTVTAACCTQMYAAPAQKSVDLRGQVCFDLMLWREAEITQITGVELAEETAKTDRPSLVVVRPGSGMTLWMLAKRYRSTREAIMAANDLQEGDSIAGKVLLIPASK